MKKERTRRGLDCESTRALDEFEREELKRLGKEVFELREDNRSLGKAVSLFVSKQHRSNGSN